ncbi:MAG: AMP-binding protein, partial [Kiritimatiellae bacterium]|nr:AMP-binding protein [Kiritimatiellia bacterium]
MNHEALFTDMTIGDFLEAETQAHPDRDFLVYPDRNLRWSYSLFNQRVNELANGLMEIGLGPNDHIGIWAKNV